MFFTFHQNNSGGTFVRDKARGITETVIVEADGLKDAATRAENIGLYFDGCDKGMDCPCCGDRWDEPWGEGDEHPTVYSKPATEYKSIRFERGDAVAIHYKDGRVEWA